MILRPYQDRGVGAIRGEYAAGADSVLYVLPTGGGKTVVFSHIAAAAAALGTRTVILVHRDTLLGQASDALDACGVPHGIVAPGFTPSREPVQVASVQALARRLKRYPGFYQFDLAVIDEAHHAVAGTWRQVIGELGARILGVTATPARADGRGLDGVFQRLVLGPSIAELTEEGHLVPALVYAPARRVDLSKVHTRAGDFDRGELHAAMDTPSITGDAVEHYTRLCPGAPAVAFCVSVQHSEDVAASFSSAGYRAKAIHGRLPLPEIRAAIAGLADGSVQVLTSCDLVSEGFDCPVVAAAILLRPTHSEGLYIQQVGRALRPAPGKDEALILDHAGNCFRHGMPDDERQWTLKGRTRKRVGEAAVAVRQCPKCYACHRPAAVCPQCGHAYPVITELPETRAGVLESVNAEKVARARMLKERVRKARTIDDFHAIAKDMGYRPAWASIRYQLTMRYRGLSR